jgi:outer membrane protein assembly factor BamB
VYAAAGNFVYALNEQSGEKIWKQTVPATSSFATAYLARGVLYVTNVSSDAVAGPQTEVRSFFAYSAQTGQLLWASGSGYGQFFNAPITNGLLFAPREYNGVYSIAGLDAETGQVAWQAPFKCGVSHFDRQVVPTCNTIWTAIINGELYLLASDAPQEGKASVTIKSFNPETGQNLSATALTLQQNSSNLLALAQNSVAVVGASNGLLYIRVGVAKTANDLPYADFIFAAYRLSDGSLAWSHAMPHFPPPTSANTTPNTSQPVLAP